MTNIYELIKTCSKLINDCEQNITLDASLYNILQKFDENEKELILDYYYGYMDNKGLLDAVLDVYYAKEGKICLNTEKSIYIMLAYTVLYSDLKFLEPLCSYFKKDKCYRFLRFFLNEKNLLTHVQDAWSLIYDQNYVEGKLIKPIVEKIPEIDDYLNELEAKLYGNKVELRPGESITIPKPFNFSKPIQRRILLPEPIHKNDDMLFKPLPNVVMPKEPPVVRQRVPIKVDRERLNKAKNKSAENVRKAPSIPDFKANTFVYQNNAEPVKLNAATILKEEYLIQRQQDELLDKYAKHESGYKSGKEFQEWQETMKRNDKLRQLEEQELKKLQSKLSFEEAIKARNNLIRMNQHKAKLANMQREAFLREHEKIERAKQADRRNLVETTKENQKKTVLVKERVKNEKRNITNQVIKETKECEILALKQIEEEMKQKIDIIQRIKAAESSSLNKNNKLVDLTKAEGHGFLNEMSIAELQERLEMLRQERHESFMKKHDEIVKTKMDKEESLVEKLQFINKFKKELNQPKKKEDVQLSLSSAKLNELKSKLDQAKENRFKSSGSLQIDASAKKKRDMYSQQREQFEKNRLKDIEQHYEKSFMQHYVNT